MSVALLRFLYLAYFVGLIGILLYNFSVLIFGAKTFAERVSHFGKALLITPVWFIALLSTSGRKRLLSIVTEESISTEQREDNDNA